MHESWDKRLRALAEGTSEPSEGEGRVLKVKLGYNPNSSSVGSMVTMLMWSATAASVTLNLFAALLRSRSNAADGDADQDPRA